MSKRKVSFFMRKLSSEIREYSSNYQFGNKMSIELFCIHLFPSKRLRILHNNHICDFLRPLLLSLTERYRSVEFTIKDKHRNHIDVWTCWFSGLDTAPDIVKLCVSSVANSLPQEAQLHIITLDNYKEYFELPKYVLEKYKSGKMSGAALSDIFRACLLSKYGGMWFDATVYVSAPISKSIIEADYYTLKTTNRLPYYDDPSEGLWCGFIWGTAPENPLFKFLRDSLLLYWERYDKVIEYLLPDYIIRIAYQSIPCIHDMIECFESNIDDIWLCMRNMESAYNAQLANELDSNTVFNKITYKRNWKRIDENGHTTLFGHLMNCIDYEHVIEEISH